MKTNRNTIDVIIAIAAREAGIRAEELTSYEIVSNDNSIIEFILETEWNSVTCFADLNSLEIVGMMGERKAA